ncbi:MAG: nitroreductase, partial [Mesorhizobium sp.]
MASPIIDFLLTRSSAPIPDLKEPAPSDAEIATMIAAASRVPDHGRL